MQNFLKKILKKKKKDSNGSNGESRVALDIGLNRIIIAEASLSKDSKLSLKKLALIERSGDADITSLIKQSIQKIDCESDGLITSLRSPQVVSRFLRFPRMNEKELRGVLQYEIEQYVPYEAKDLYMDLCVLQESIKTDQAENSEIFVAVVKKENLDQLLKDYKAAECEVSTIDVDMLACMRSLEFFQPEDFNGHTAILDLGAQVSTLGVVRNSLPKFIRDLSFGTQDIVKKLKSRAVVSDEEIQLFISGQLQVTDENKENFAESIENLLNDIKVSFDFYQDQSDDGQGPDKLIVCGYGAGQGHILSSLNQILDIPVEKMAIESKVELSNEVDPELFSKNLIDLPVVLGLVLHNND